MAWCNSAACLLWELEKRGLDNVKKGGKQIQYSTSESALTYRFNARSFSSNCLSSSNVPSRREEAAPVRLGPPLGARIGRLDAPASSSTMMGWMDDDEVRDLPR